MNCPLCRNTLKNQVEFCPNCGVNTAKPDEVVEDLVDSDYMKGMFGVYTGTLFATDKRLFWSKNNDGLQTAMTVGGGLIGGLLAGLFTKKKGTILFSLPYNEIESTEEARQGVRKGLRIYDKSGNKYKILTKRNVQWIEFIESKTI